jgi:predicted deacylase
MSEYVEVGSLRVRRGTKDFGRLKVARGGDGGELSVGVHVIAGATAGPKLTVLATQHGNEIRQVAITRRVLESLDPAQMAGDVVLIPVANPIAFAMGSRNGWMDGLWGDIANMNRVWPGRWNGWITEKFCHVIATQVFPGSGVVIDLHSGPDPWLALGYGYLGRGGPGEREYDLSVLLGAEMNVYQSEKELEEKRETNGTTQAYLRSVGITPVCIEIGDSYGHESQRGQAGFQMPRDAVSVGTTAVLNIAKALNIVPGEPQLPPFQTRHEPEVVVRPTEGGLIESFVGIPDIGRVFPEGFVFGELRDPQSFEVIEQYTAPWEATVLLGNVPSATVHTNRARGFRVHRRR